MSHGHASSLPHIHTQRCLVETALPVLLAPRPGAAPLLWSSLRDLAASPGLGPLETKGELLALVPGGTLLSGLLVHPCC